MFQDSALGLKLFHTLVHNIKKYQNLLSMQFSKSKEISEKHWWDPNKMSEGGRVQVQF